MIFAISNQRAWIVFSRKRSTIEENFKTAISIFINLHFSYITILITSIFLVKLTNKFIPLTVLPIKFILFFIVHSTLKQYCQLIHIIKCIQIPLLFDVFKTTTKLFTKFFICDCFFKHIFYFVGIRILQNSMCINSW